MFQGFSLCLVFCTFLVNSDIKEREVANHHILDAGPKQHFAYLFDKLLHLCRTEAISR